MHDCGSPEERIARRMEDFDKMRVLFLLGVLKWVRLFDRNWARDPKPFGKKVSVIGHMGGYVGLAGLRWPVVFGGGLCFLAVFRTDASYGGCLVSETEEIGSCNESLPDSIERWYPRLMKAATTHMPKSLMDRCSAEDFVQDTILIGLVHWNKTAGRNENEITAWLMLILRNCIRMEFRRSVIVRGNKTSNRIRNCDQHFLESICENRDDQFHATSIEDTLQDLRKEIDSLPEGMRQIVIWRFFEHRDFEWIGERLGVSSRQARRRLHQALNQVLAQYDQLDTADSST